jgi:hypothetical protein
MEQDTHDNNSQKYVFGATDMMGVSLISFLISLFFAAKIKPTIVGFFVSEV